MKTSRLLLLAVLLLTTGIFFITSYCHGTAGFDAGIPVDGTKIHIDITTTGWPALIGAPCTLFGLFFLCIAFLSAIGKEILLRKTRTATLASSETTPLE
jgi:hypothetical protein